MAIRVTQNTMYNKMVGHMQSNLGAYMESVEQGASQKKINRPSDDPAGTYRVLTTRVDLNQTAQFKENVDTAKGWLNLADDVLSKQTATAITGLKALAEQASTGTYTREQRMIMADQARQYFGQLLNLSNTQFEGKSIFAGHKYGQNAFELGMGITCADEDWNKLINDGDVAISGSSERTILIDFVTGAPGETKTLEKDMKYRWSNDGGMTWNDDSVGLEPNENGGTDLTLKPKDTGVVIKIDKDKAPQVTGSDPDAKLEEHGPSFGTFLYVRPTAIYQGDDEDPPAQISVMGAGALTSDKVHADGSFGGNVFVRIDGAKGKDAKDQPILKDVDLAEDKEFYWSYSTDGGTTWVERKDMVSGEDKQRLLIPGGYVELNLKDQETLNKGSQILVHPSRADLDYEILKDTYLSVNSVGKEVFGGWYEDKPAMKDNEENLFEVVGSFIGYLEGNSQEGCQKTLAALTKAEKRVLSEATRIGGMENRLEMASDVLSFQAIDQQERLSYVEDIDLTELLTKLTRQQLSYQTVLQSSSMIMQMSLAKYV